MRAICFHLMQNEWRYWRYAKTPTWLLVGLFMLWITAAFSTHHHWQEHESTLNIVNQQSMRDWQSQPERHPHRVSHFGDFVAKPIHALTMIEPGIIDQVGHLVYLEAHRLNSANFNPATEATSLGRFPSITPAMVVQWWMPLFIIMMGNACITREKFSGSLEFMRGNGTSSLDIALGKWLSLFLPFFALIIVQALLALFLSWGSEEITLRLASLLLAECIYIAAWCLLVVGVSWLCRQQHTALLSLLLIWILVCIVFPRGLANIAQALHPTQPRAVAEFNAEQKLKKIGDSHNPNDPHFAEFKSQTLKKYAVKRIEDLPVNYHGLLMQEGERLTTQVYREQQFFHAQQLKKQNDTIQKWLWLSPALALQYIHMASSGNDIAHHQAFLQQAETRRFALISYLNQIHTQHVQQQNDKNIRLSTDFWRNAPRPPVTLAPMQVSFSTVLLAISVLLAWLLLPAYGLAKWLKRR